MVTVIGETPVTAAITSPHFKSIGCQQYAEMELCQGLYNLERTWVDAVTRCQDDGWTGLAIADTADVKNNVFFTCKNYYFNSFDVFAQLNSIMSNEWRLNVPLDTL